MSAQDRILQENIQFNPVPANEPFLNAGDRKPIDLPVFIPDTGRHPVNPSPSGQPGGHSDQNSGFDSGNSSAANDKPGVTPQPLTLERWLQAGGVTTFNYDPNLSNEENLSNLFTWMNSVFDMYKFSSDSNQLNFGNLLSYVFTSINTSKNEFMRDLSDSASLELAEKITDVTFSFISQQFSQAASLQSWYLQQEYNTPLSQVNRLAEAGLNTAFALGNLSSGNAGSSASVPMLQMPGESNAGQAQQQSESSWLGFLGQGLSAAASFIPAVGPAVGAVMSAAFSQFVGKKMLPYNIAKAGAEVVSMGQSFLNLQDTNDLTKANTAIAEFNVEKDAADLDMRLAKQEVDTSKEYYESLYSKFSQEYEELGFETDVVTKEGRHEKRWLSVDETNAVRAGKTTLSDGSVVAGITSLEELRESNINLNAGLDLPFAGKVGVTGGAHASDKSTRTDSDTRSKSKSNEVSNSDTQTNRTEEWSDDGSSFRIENAKFTSVTKRTRLPLPEYADKIKAAQKAYEKQLDRYDTLSTFNKARLQLASEKLTRNLSKLSESVVKARMKSVIDKILFPDSSTLVGD